MKPLPALWLDAFHSTRPNGTGMGLSVRCTIIEQPGGRLWAVANGGPSTTFHFTL